MIDIIACNQYPNIYVDKLLPTKHRIERFQTKLLNWYSANKRDLPWRETTDSYRIWVSQVMLLFFCSDEFLASSTFTTYNHS